MQSPHLVGCLWGDAVILYFAVSDDINVIFYLVLTVCSWVDMNILSPSSGWSRQHIVVSILIKLWSGESGV